MKNYKYEIKAELKKKNADFFQEIKKLEAEYKEIRNKEKEDLDRLLDEIKELKGSEEKKDKAWEAEEKKIKNKYREDLRSCVEKIDRIEQKINNTKVTKELEVDNFKVKITGWFEKNYDTDSFLYEERHSIIDKVSVRKYWHKNLFDFGDTTGREGLAAYFADEDKDKYDELDKENIKKIEALFGQGIRM